MSFDINEPSMKNILIPKKLMNPLARPNLVEAMEHETACLLKGRLFNNTDMLDEWILLIKKRDGWAIVSDTPHPATEDVKMFSQFLPDSYREIIIDTQCTKKLFYVLMNLYNIEVTNRRKKGGRPSSCTEEAVKEMVALRDQGWSNRKIAKEKGKSPATVRKWLDSYDLGQKFKDIQ